MTLGLRDGGTNAGYRAAATAALVASMTSPALVTSAPCQFLMMRWHPADRSEVIGPGTAISGRRRSRACRAVFIAPLRSLASTTTVPVASAAFLQSQLAVA
jgi:hypothetical protein